eukprot:Gregarina_sp_Poly_1__8447@NODE_497_length_7922_cov_26_990834_g53_i1_p8_GENE_NODE_497_length_7922_cov_26_990834_g53_i1NODE_497_length_7922_cov_26_990834_g53_i1_p8_ORF_typecomplete_len106_score13_50_NODE_497_length_7922_cov_26_990834_g53_i115391856
MFPDPKEGETRILGRVFDLPPPSPKATQTMSPLHHECVLLYRHHVMYEPYEGPTVDKFRETLGLRDGWRKVCVETPSPLVRVGNADLILVQTPQYFNKSEFPAQI